MPARRRHKAPTANKPRPSPPTLPPPDDLVEVLPESVEPEPLSELPLAVTVSADNTAWLRDEAPEDLVKRHSSRCVPLAKVTLSVAVVLLVVCAWVTPSTR